MILKTVKSVGVKNCFKSCLKISQCKKSHLPQLKTKKWEKDHPSKWTNSLMTAFVSRGLVWPCSKWWKEPTAPKKLSRSSKSMDVCNGNVVPKVRRSNASWWIIQQKPGILLPMQQAAWQRQTMQAGILCDKKFFLFQCTHFSLQSCLAFVGVLWRHGE